MPREYWAAAAEVGHIFGPYWGTVRTAGRGGVKRMGVMGGAMALWAGQGNNRSPLGGAVARSAGLSPYFVLSLFTRSHTCSSTTAHSTSAKGLWFRVCKTPDKIQIKTKREGNSIRTDTYNLADTGFV